ncbi:poly(ADP-ribose) glycohydrolase [Tetranychus urticae]|uniref:poly(ADP-ribose) glycohydrolase n=1 Tax=Tetranychus urticae TaxID=32264 RepID=T1JWT6_TETUR|nr:poly(ADP-ribose) glycohydrolase [Tetranychus urticae]
MSVCSAQSDCGFNREPDCCASLGELRPSSDKTIFYQIPLPDDGPPKPYPVRFVYNWSPTASAWVLSSTYPAFSTPSNSSTKEYVKMPFSVDNQSKQGIIESSQWTKIVKVLTSSKIKTSTELVAVIKDYNPSMARMSFNVLRTLIDDCYSEVEKDLFFTSTLPKMIALTLELPKFIRQPIPILKQRTNHSLFFSQQQIASLLCNGFFCTFPEHRQAKLQDFSFAKLFSHPNDERFTRKLEKLKCIINYFQRVVSDPPKGVVSFERRYLADNEITNWSSSNYNLKRICVCPKGAIETHGFGMLQADFANKYVGGGVLRSGLVQEEIRFVINPELMASMLFTEVLLENEALLITGTEQFNKYSGYGDTFLYDGNYYDPTPTDEWGRRYTKIVAMDASYFPADKVRNQYRKGCIDRELIKAYVAFMERRKLDPKNRCAVATGNWGCGVYRGDPQLKSLIQLIAASLNEKDLVYFTFGDFNLSTNMNKIVTSLAEKNVSAGQLYQFLLDYGSYVSSLDHDQEMEPLFDYIERKFLS